MNKEDKINDNGKPWSVEFYCDDETCVYTENELYMPGEVIPHMFTDHFCPMCGGILRRSDVGNNNKRYKWND